MDGARIGPRRPGRAAVRAVLVAAALVATAPLVSAAAPAATSGLNGTTSKTAKQDAVDHLPLEKLSPANREKVEHVLADAAMYRQLPVSMCRCEPQLYLLLVNRPDTVVNIWEVLGISQFELRQVGPNLYQADDGTGMQTTVEFLHRSHDAHIAYVEGMYEGPLLSRKIKAECVLFLRSSYAPTDDGSWMITHRLDAFVRFDAIGAEMLARTMNSMIGKIADRNFREVSNFITNLATRAEDDAEWTADLASKLDNVRPDVRDQFARVTARMAAKHADEPRLVAERVDVGPPPAPAPPAEIVETSPAAAPKTIRSRPAESAPTETPALVAKPIPPVIAPERQVVTVSAPPAGEEELDWETDKAPIARPVASRAAIAPAVKPVEGASSSETTDAPSTPASTKTMRTTAIKPTGVDRSLARPNASPASSLFQAPPETSAANASPAVGESGPAFPE